MESVIKCFDVVNMVVEEASDRFKPLWKVDKEKLDILHEYCDAIDGILKEFAGDSVDVDIDEIKMTISITIECEDLTIESKEHQFHQLVERAVKFCFSKSSEREAMCVNFVFPSVCLSACSESMSDYLDDDEMNLVSNTYSPKFKVVELYESAKEKIENLR